MTRLLCFTFVLLLSLPVFAQETPVPMGMELPQDPAYLMRLREDITLQIQETQRILGLVNPSDTRTIDTLRIQQAELTQQLRDVIQQLQTAAPPGMGRNAGMTPPGMPPMSVQQQLPTQQMPSWGAAGIGMGGTGGTVSPVMTDPNLMYGYSNVDPMTGQPLTAPPAMMPTPIMPSALPGMPPFSPPAQWGGMGVPNPAWGGTAQETVLPRELTEVKQTLDTLRREVSELKELIKTLETRVQLLNRDLMLNERLRENGN